MANTTGLDRGAGAVLELIVGGAATAVDMFRVKNRNAFALRAVVRGALSADAFEMIEWLCVHGRIMGSFRICFPQKLTKRTPNKAKHLSVFVFLSVTHQQPILPSVREQ